LPDVPVIELETHVAAPPERCFDLSLSVELHLESAAATGERVVAGRRSGQLRPGEWVTWEARHLGKRRRLTVEIADHDRPRHFRDRQVEGPFRRMVHDHWFDPRPDGTVMRDRFDFSTSLGPLDRLVVAPHLRRLLLTRNAAIKAAAER
jgi:ligand-binding SRPBCC domain-containing protein